MSGKKISDLTEVTTVPTDSYTIIVDGTDNKKIKLEAITKDLSDNISTLNSKVVNIETTTGNLSNNINTLDSKVTNVEDKIGDEDLATASKTINGAINELFQSVSNGKSLIASAITDKGVMTSENDTFETMAENILLINTNSVDVDINTEGLLLYVNASKKMPINNTTWKSLIGSRAINLHNTTEAYFITKSDGSGYIDNVGKLYGTLEENLNLGTSMTLVMKINNNSINGWTELFATGMGDSAISLTYGNNNNPILFAHDDVQNEYIKLTINQWYEVAVVLFSNKIDYYLNGNLVGTSTLNSTASTDGLYEDINYFFSRGDNNRLTNLKVEYIEIYNRSLTSQEIKSNFDILNPTYQGSDENVDDEVTGFSTDYFTEDSISNFNATNAYYLSPNGSDSNNGTSRSTPFLTVGKYISTINSSTITESTLYIEDGDYKLTSSNTISGSGRVGTACRVTFQGIGNKANFTQATKLTNYTTQTINGKTVYIYDVSSLSSFSLSTGASNIGLAPFLMVNGKRMAYSQYPKGSYGCESVEKNLQSVNGTYITASTIDHNVFNNITDWSNTVCEGTFGDSIFYNYLISVSSYDKTNKRINLGKSIRKGKAATPSGFIYRIINNKNLLTQAGEYYYDFTNKKIYLIPPTDISDCKVELVNGADFGYAFNIGGQTVDSNEYYNDLNITFNKVNFVGMKAGAIYGNLSGVTINKCRFSGISKEGVYALNAKNLTVKNSRFTYTGGMTAIGIVNGTWTDTTVAKKNRQNLISCGCNIYNNNIEHHCEYIDGGSFKFPIWSLTVGNNISHNNIKNVTGVAINFQYNDNIIEYNDIENSCYLICDTGAIYVGRDLLAYGNIIRNNKIYGNLNSNPNRWQMGVYLDDVTCGVSVLDNHIEDMGWGIYLNGGAYNTLSGNIMKNCGSAIRCTALWAWYPTGTSTCSPTWGQYWTDKNFDGTLRGRTYKTYPYYLNNSIWTTKYGNKVKETFGGLDPKTVASSVLTASPSPYWIWARCNTITNNTAISCTEPFYYYPKGSATHGFQDLINDGSAYQNIVNGNVIK